MDRVFAVFYEGQLLVTIKARPAVLVDRVLDAYAEQYDFDRKKLTGTVVDFIPCPDMKR